MKEWDLWQKHHHVVHSAKGQWKVGEGVFNKEYEMMNDLVGNVSYMQVVVLNATGRLPSKQIAEWIDAVHICLSWPDPRIWCNRVGALAGTVGTSPVAGTIYGILSSDSRMFGIKPLQEGVEFIQYALSQINSGISPIEFVSSEIKKRAGKPNFMGYARPIAKGDERIPAMEKVSEQLKLPPGEHLKLAYSIEQILNEQFDETMNINGYMSAFLSDQNYTPQEVYRIFSILVASGVTACYADAYDREAGTFSPLKCSDIEYLGPSPKIVPTKL